MSRTRTHDSARDSEIQSAAGSMIDEEGGSYVPSSRESSLSPLPISVREATPPAIRRNFPSNDDRPLLNAYDTSSSSQDSIISVPSLPRRRRPSHAHGRSPTPFPSNPSPSTSHSSASSVELEGETKSQGERRYTAQEKGKGRAIVAQTPIEIESSPEKESAMDGDQSIQLIGSNHKRRRLSSDDIVNEFLPSDRKGEEFEAPEEDDSLGGGYSCPVCFCPPSQAVMTPCGHILCAQCLHSSLTAAIGRNPNPYPDNITHARGGGRGSRGSRGGPPRNTRTSRAAAAHASPHNPAHSNLTEPRWGPGPNEWSKEFLQEYWHRYLTKLCENQLRKTKVPKGEWEAIKDVQVEKVEDVKVDHVLKGLWKVDGQWVVEGECPVCRNSLPGGYGPPGSGIGGVVPLLPRLSGPVHGHTAYQAKRRR
ncbi:hypothetical protein I317_03786 [Kwoniella heveanensis CBS 569]|nr:hypothetical protein I317_03786 [Kwoniella heveanensis CBS 569]